MKTRNVIMAVILFYIFPLAIYTHANAQSTRCQTQNFNPNQTFITFYGDSLGNLINAPLYGYFGWDFYLTAQNPNVDWHT